ncbi:MAG: BrnT family toxin [bacterium]
MRPQDIKSIFISDRVIEKIVSQHHVSEEEVSEVFENPDAAVKIRRSPRVKDAYIAFGRTWGGRYLTVPFYRKSEGLIHIGSARDMTSNERTLYERS